MKRARLQAMLVLVGAMLGTAGATHATSPAAAVVWGVTSLDVQSVAQARRTAPRTLNVSVTRGDIASVDVRTRLYFNDKLLASLPAQRIVPAASLGLASSERPIAIGSAALRVPAFDADGLYAERIAVVAQLDNGMELTSARTDYYIVSAQVITKTNIRDYSQRAHRLSSGFDRQGRSVMHYEGAIIPVPDDEMRRMPVVQAERIE